MEAKKIEAILKKLSLRFDEWRQNVLKGKLVLSTIISKLYPMEKTREPEPPLSLNDDCQELDNLLAEMKECLESIEDCARKLIAFQNLSNLSISFETTSISSVLMINEVPVNLKDVNCWLQEITIDYAKQLRMDECILENICHLETREQALFHQGTWTTQPAISKQTELHLKCIKLILNEPS
eukprot:TRINITY_DN10409_c0_g1_i1.p1 TRINITY_DN10409_c0_g1~~TRINITY_DN10409_c0_g1_i1.p1  ORF type:complete len:182 (-),score=31.06 TRINITY_DN10409_c0_g1_i1:106-651(-)